MKKSILAIAALLVIQAGSLVLAQDKKLMFHLSGGASAPLGNEQFTDMFSAGPNGSLGLDYWTSPQMAVSVELGYSTFALDRKGFLKSAGAEDDPSIKVKGGDMNIVEVLGLGKYYFKPADTKTNFYGIGGLGLAAGQVSDLTVTTPEGEFKSASDSGTDFMMVLGAGVKHHLGSKWKAYMEVRYSRVFSDETVSYLPVRIGTIF